MPPKKAPHEPQVIFSTVAFIFGFGVGGLITSDF